MNAGSTYHSYYEVLGLQPGATLDEVKRAYRRMAKRYHPDVSKAPDAEERFIEVNEAYEFLYRLLTTPEDVRAAQRQRRQAYARARARTAEELFRQWLEEERRKARARAAEAARQRYREFMRSPIYRTSQIVSAAYDYIILGVGLLIIGGAITGMIRNLRDIADTPQMDPFQRTDLITSQIVSTVLLSLVGLVFIFFARLAIRDRIAKRKKRKKNP